MHVKFSFARALQRFTKLMLKAKVSTKLIKITPTNFYIIKVKTIDKDIMLVIDGTISFFS